MIVFRHAAKHFILATLMAVAAAASSAEAQSRDQLLERFRESCRAKFDHLRGKGQPEVVRAHVKPCVQAAMQAHVRGELEAIRARGDALIDAGKLTEAEATARAGIVRARSIRNPDLPPWPGGYAMLGRVLSFQGRLAEAEQATREALGILQKQGDSGSAANVSRLLGSILANQGRHAEADELFTGSLVVLERNPGPKDPQTAQTLVNIAYLRLDQGRFAEAEDQARRALTIFEAHERKGAWTARSLQAVGRACLATGRFAEAEELLKSALAVGETSLGPKSWELAQMLRFLGETYYRTGRLTDAEPILSRAVENFQAAVGLEHRGATNAMRVLGTVRLALGDHAGAETMLRQGLTYAQNVGGTNKSDNLGLTYLYLSLADAARIQNRASEAEELAKSSLKAAEQIGSETPFVGHALMGLGRHFMGVKRFDEAKAAFTKAISIAEKTEDGLSMALGLRWLADLDLQGGNPADAQTKLKRVISLLDARRASPRILVGDRFNDEIAPMLRWVAVGSATASWQLQQAGPHASAEAESFLSSQIYSQSTAATAITQVASRLAATDDKLGQLVRAGQDLLNRWQAIDQQLTETLQEGSAAANVRRPLRAELDEIGKELARVGSRISAEFPQYAALTKPSPLTVSEVQGLIGAEEAVVTFLVGDRQSYLWAISQDRVVWRRLTMGQAALADKIERLRKGLDIAQLQKSAVDGSPASLFDLELAHELYRDLLQPAAEVISGKRNLLVVPSGPLTSLPFHLLLTDPPARPVTELKQIPLYRAADWIIKRHAVTILPSVASLKALRSMAKPSQDRRPIIGFADPSFGSPPVVVAAAPPPAQTASSRRTRAYSAYWKGGVVDLNALRTGLDPLPETADELRAVAKGLGAAEDDVHLGTRATEAAVKKAALNVYRVIYFATHGLVAGEMKGLAEPALVLSLPSSASKLDDGLLTASEVAQLKLDADWVVLSACNTAAGNKAGAEAFSGLARAFFFAGARSLLVSHWPVDSSSAVRLTTSLFETLKEHPDRGRADALRQSMLALMNDPSDVLNAYPALWAPFAVVGEGRS